MAAVDVATAPLALAEQTSQTFTTAGTTVFTVPAGVTAIQVTAVGGAGRGCFDAVGGRGASVTAIVHVSAGDELLVGVGGRGDGEGNCGGTGNAGGAGGGGAGGSGFPFYDATGGGGGGGASTVSAGPGAITSSTAIVVAAGGGGAAYRRAGGDAGSAGAGGNAGPGGPGTQSAGGAGGAGQTGTGGASGTAGAAGTAFTGGAGGIGGAAGFTLGGGGGGGGYYGGGGGGGSAPNGYAGAGGGGSSYLDPDAYVVSAPAPTSSAASVTITYPAVAPPRAVIASPATGGIYAVGASVSTTFSCEDGIAAGELVSCNDSEGTHTVSGGSGHLDTSSPGTHTYTVEATASGGLTGTKTISYQVGEPPTATIVGPAAGGVYQLNQTVVATFTCAEAAEGPELTACDVSTATEPQLSNWWWLDTSALGAQTFTVVATSANGLTGSASISYTVVAPPPPTATISAPATGGVYQLNQIVPTTFTCVDGVIDSWISTCDDSNLVYTEDGGSGQLDTSTLGAHTYTVTAGDDYSSDSTSISYTVVAPPPPTATISAPAGGGVYRLGQSVPTTFTCADGGGPAVVGCVDSNGVSTVSGGAGALDTTTPGAHTYTVTASSGGGRTGSTSLAYKVLAAQVSIKTGSATMSRGRVKVAVSCTGAMVCRGTLKLVSGRVVVATKAYSVTGGKTASITLSVTKAGKRLLAKAKRHRISTRATATVAGGATAKRTIAVKLR